MTSGIAWDVGLAVPMTSGPRVHHALPEEVRATARVLRRGVLHHVEDKPRGGLVLRVVVPRPEVLDLVAHAVEQVILALELLR